MEQNNTYYFRRVSQEDLEGVYTLLSTGLDEVERKYFPCTIEEVQTILNSAKDYAYVITDDCPSNFLAYGHMRTFNGKYETPALGIMVSRYFRGLNLGKILCNYMLCDTYAMGYKDVMLKVNNQNRKALQLYLDLGFVMYNWDSDFIWLKKKF